MKSLISKLEDIWVSVTFAEAGEHETSQQILAQDVHETGEVESCPAV